MSENIRLEDINFPADLKQLDEQALQTIADQLRDFLITSVSKTGGHLAAGLGVVELTVALHSVFDTPHDRIIWDVGHQAYPHKILTGRRDRMSTIRQKNGLSGFQLRSESEYDAFGAGHSSTSIGAGLGMALASQQQGVERQVIPIIGDGALSAGMAFEALNHAGSIEDLNMLVIINDNEMSISAPVGAISRYLTRILSSRFYNSVRDGGKQVLSGMPNLRDIVGRWEEHMKGMVMPGTLFEELGFTYFGPIDGHDLSLLTDTLHNLKTMHGPRILHIVTQKGKGFEPAEGDPCGYHGVTPFDLKTGEMGASSQRKTYTSIFSDWLVDAATADDRLMAITPAMCEGSGLVEFATHFPNRYFDVGIAEQHAVTLAAGMACEGAKPVVAIYSTFFQRAYDQLLHDVALQNLDVTFAVDRAGQVGADGATHAGSFDLSFVRAIPNMVVMTPANEKETRDMLQTAYLYQGPAMVRYPRGSGTGVLPDESLEVLEIGVAKPVREGKGVAILAFGSMLSVCEKVASQLDATLINMRFVKPLDEKMVIKMAESHELLVTVEENVIQGGAGSAVNEFVNQAAIKVSLLNLGLPDKFIEHATVEEQLRQSGLNETAIIHSIVERTQQLAVVSGAK